MNDGPPPPGAVPQAISPQQVTAPLPLHPQPAWVYPPPPEPKKDSHGLDVAKLLGLALTIGSIIFAAGAANEKLKSIEASQSAATERERHRVRLEDDRYDKLKSAFEAQGGKFDALAEQVKQARWQRHGRRREADGIDSRP